MLRTGRRASVARDARGRVAMDRDDGVGAVDNIVTQFSTYEDFLDSQITTVDLYYLEVRVAPQSGPPLPAPRAPFPSLPEAPRRAGVAPWRWTPATPGCAGPRRLRLRPRPRLPAPRGLRRCGAQAPGGGQRERRPPARGGLRFRVCPLVPPGPLLPGPCEEGLRADAATPCAGLESRRAAVSLCWARRCPSAEDEPCGASGVASPRCFRCDAGRRGHRTPLGAEGFGDARRALALVRPAGTCVPGVGCRAGGTAAEAPGSAAASGGRGGPRGRLPPSCPRRRARTQAGAGAGLRVRDGAFCPSARCGSRTRRARRAGLPPRPPARRESSRFLRTRLRCRGRDVPQAAAGGARPPLPPAREGPPRTGLSGITAGGTYDVASGCKNKLFGILYVSRSDVPRALPRRPRRRTGKERGGTTFAGGGDGRPERPASVRPPAPGADRAGRGASPGARASATSGRALFVRELKRSLALGDDACPSVGAAGLQDGSQACGDAGRSWGSSCPGRKMKSERGE